LQWRAVLVQPVALYVTNVINVKNVMNAILLCRTEYGKKNILPHKTRRTKCGLFCYAGRSTARKISYRTKQDARSAAYFAMPDGVRLINRTYYNFINVVSASIFPSRSIIFPVAFFPSVKIKP